MALGVEKAYKNEPEQISYPNQNHYLKKGINWIINYVSTLEKQQFSLEKRKHWKAYGIYSTIGYENKQESGK